MLLLASGGGRSIDFLDVDGQITDQTGVLGSGPDQVQAALDSLLNGENVQLWRRLHPQRTARRNSLAQQTFEANGLGGNDMVLLVAVNDHRYGWWEKEDSGTGLPTSQVDSLVSSAMDSLLKSGDYAGAIIACERLGDAIKAARAPVSKPTAYATRPTGRSGSSGPATRGRLTVLWTLIAVILIGGGLILVYLWIVSRRRNRLSAEERDKRTGDLARQANQMLLATDDALHEPSRSLGSPRPSSTRQTRSRSPTRSGLPRTSSRRPSPSGSSSTTRSLRINRPRSGCTARSSPAARLQCRDRRRGQAASGIAGPREDRARRAGCASQIDRDLAGPAARDPGGNEDFVRLRAIELGGREGQRRGGGQARPLCRAADRSGQRGPEPPPRPNQCRGPRRARRPGGSGSGQPASRCR